MGISTLLETVMLVMNNSAWVSESDWQCLGSITKNYFTNNSRVILLDQKNPQFHRVLFQETPIYIYNNIEIWRYDLFDELRVLLFNVDFIIIRYLQNDAMFETLTGGRTIAINGLYQGTDARDHDFHEMKSVYMFRSPDDEQSDLYSWDPSGECWTDRGKKIFVYQDTCKDGTLANSTNLYPLKTSEQLIGCPLIVDKNKYSKSLLNFYTNGPLYKLIKTIAEKLKASLKEATYGDYAPHGGFDFSQKAEVFPLCFYGFLPPFFQGDLVVAVPTPNPDLFASLYSGFGTVTWCLVGTGLVTMAFFVFVIDFISDGRTVQSYTVADVLRTVVGHSVVGRPKYFVSFQVIVIIFEFYSLHIIWFYQITSLENLFFGFFEAPIRTLQDAKDRNLTMHYNDVLLSIRIEEMNERPYSWNDYNINSNYLEDEDNSRTLKNAIEEKTGMLFDIKEDINFHMRQLYPKEPLSSKFNFLKPTISSEHYTLCLDATHPLHGVFSRYTTNIIEAGLFNYWMKSYSDVEKFAEVKEKRPLTIAHMQPVFTVVLMSLSLAVLLFFIEISVLNLIKKLFLKVKYSKRNLRFQIHKSEVSNIYLD